MARLPEIGVTGVTPKTYPMVKKHKNNCLKYNNNNHQLTTFPHQGRHGYYLHYEDRIFILPATHFDIYLHWYVSIIIPPYQPKLCIQYQYQN